MRMTELEMVQDILNSLGSDRVNSLYDTEDAESVTQILRTTVKEVATRQDWPYYYQNMGLGSEDIAYPVAITIPNNVLEVKKVYNSSTLSSNVATGPVTTSTLFDGFKELTYKFPDEFLEILDLRDASEDTVYYTSIGFGTTSNIHLKIYHDRAPLYWTSFDDRQIIVDAYDDSLAEGFSPGQIRAYVRTSPLTGFYEEGGSTYPDIPTEAFPLVLAEAKATAFYELNETVNQKAEQQAQRQKNVMLQKGWVAHGGIRFKNYGRK